VSIAISRRRESRKSKEDHAIDSIFSAALNYASSKITKPGADCVKAKFEQSRH